MSIAIAIGFVFLILFTLGGAAWGPWAQAPPGIKRMRKTKPMAMAMLMPILIGTFFQNALAPSSLAPFSFVQKFRLRGT